MSLQDLVKKLHDDQMRKRDLVVPKSCLRMQGGKICIINIENSDALTDLMLGTGISMEMEGLRALKLEALPDAHRQIASKLDIPWQYYEKANLPEHFRALDECVNYWLRQLPENTNFFMRMFVDPDEENGILRAMLSDRFKAIDHLDVLMSALEAIQKSGVKTSVENADITDKKMYVRIEAPDIVKDSPTLLKKYTTPNNYNNGGGDTGIVAGFILTNSETGHGQFNISPRLVIRACDNGMIQKGDAMRKVHLGERMEEYSTIEWSEETKQKNLELIMAQTKDAVTTFLSEKYLGKTVSRLEEVAGKKLEHPMDSIRNVSRQLSFTDEKEKQLLDYFMQGATQTPFGVSQALTFYAHRDADADERYELEKVGAEVLTANSITSYDKPYQETRKRKQKVDPNLN